MTAFFDTPHKPLAVCVYTSRSKVEEEVLLFYAHVARVASKAGAVLLLHCELLRVTAGLGIQGVERVRHETLTVPSEEVSMTPEIVDKIRALAKAWGVE